MEAPQTEDIWQEYLAENEEYLNIIGYGFDWTSYNCQGWASAFGITYPILDGGTDGGYAWDLFGDGYIPHNVVIDHNYELIYTSSGYNESAILSAINLGLSYVPRDKDEDGIMDSDDNCIDTPNFNQFDLDLDGAGDACDLCDNANVFVRGNINGSGAIEGSPTIDLFDILSLAEILLSGIDEGCAYEISDMRPDGDINVLDIITLVQFVLNGSIDETNDISTNSEGIFEIQHSQIGDKVIISSPEKISGFQFEMDPNVVSEQDIESFSFPEGWVIDYSYNENYLKILGYDITGKNPQEQIKLDFQSISVGSFNNLVFSDPNAQEIILTFSDYESQINKDIIPNHPHIHKLYPNPFNPSLTISVLIPSEEEIRIAIYNMLGHEIDVIIDKEFLSPGQHTFFWNADQYPSGLYIVNIQSGSYIDTQKALFLK